MTASGSNTVGQGGDAFDIVACDSSPGYGGYYPHDLRAIQAGAQSDGLIYRGAPLTPGHRHIRNPACALLLRLRSSDGHAAWGDAVTVQYAGFAGREPPVDPSALKLELDRAFADLRGAGRVSFAEA